VVAGEEKAIVRIYGTLTLVEDLADRSLMQKLSGAISRFRCCSSGIRGSVTPYDGCLFYCPRAFYEAGSRQIPDWPVAPGNRRLSLVPDFPEA